MRMMMKVQIPTAAGNAAIKDGSLSGIMQRALETVKAEAAYFTTDNGMRTAFIFFEMEESSDMPRSAEPLFMGLDAAITFAPAMNAEEVGVGLGKLAV